ncbi:MAG: M20/M25/M40 family metallo-hydrolase [Sphingobium sp.]
MKSIRSSLGLLAAATSMASPALANSDPGLAREVLLKSIEYRTVVGEGQVPALAAYYKSVLTKAGFADGDIEIMPVGETAVLVATLRGSDPSLKPIGLLGHMDVVEAKREDWVRDPFKAVEEGGFIFGRGAEDNKYDVAMMVATFAQLKKEGYEPRRSLILLLSGDEESNMTSAPVLAAKFPDLEMVLNGDGGGGVLGADGQPEVYHLQAGEKTYGDYDISFTDPGGHSSAPTPTNPIYRLARALDRLAAYQFPPMINELTRASFLATAPQAGGEVGSAMARYARDQDPQAAAILSARPEYVGQVRTTCVATQIEGGHAANALPQRATATVNCRIFPGVSLGQVRDQIEKVVADPSAKVTARFEDVWSDASPLRKDIMDAVTKAVHTRYPKLKITPSMTSGATDSLFFRAKGIPSYGVSSLFQKPGDSMAHGLNERVPVAGIKPSLEQWYSLVTTLSN